MLGFAAGVMLAASVWSLLLPAIESTRARGGVPWLPAALGFLLGGAFLFALDKLLPHLHPGLAESEAEGPPTPWRRAMLLVLAITLHNIPEGLAVGVAFGAAASGAGGTGFGAAVALALGIGLQNVPEGVAVALPLRAEGMRRRSALAYGQLSALVEPFAAALGAAAVLLVRPALPYALAFAAGAMVFVVVEELVPESQEGGFGDVATAALLVGFALVDAGRGAGLRGRPRLSPAAPRRSGGSSARRPRGARARSERRAAPARAPAARAAPGRRGRARW